MEILSLAGVVTILAVAVGLGFVIFVHELGHFLLAKWNGVKVEKFSIGFGPALLRLRRGETEYVLAAFPLGGFVKMLGESPEGGEEEKTANRAYHNRPVGARMAIISAGVIMNLIFGLACFVAVYARGGLPETPAILGVVVAGQPAYEAGVRVGDEVVAVDGRREVSFQELKRTVALSGTGQVVRLELKRPGRPEPVLVAVEPRREAGAEQPTIGIAPARDLTLIRVTDLPPFVPPPGMEAPPSRESIGLRGGDRVVAAGPMGQAPQPLADSFALDALLARDRNQTLDVVVERRGSAGRAGPERATTTLPPNHVVDFGFRLTAGPISSIQGGSPAASAGFRVGDRILKVNGDADFDPMQLPDRVAERAGRPMTFEVGRTAGGGIETVTIAVTPEATPPWHELITPREPLDLPGIGLALPIETRIAAVRDGSPAAKAGLTPGQVIRSMTVRFPAPGKGGDTSTAKDQEKTLTFVGEEDSRVGWPYAFGMLQNPAPVLLAAREVELTIAGLADPVRLASEAELYRFYPHRGLLFEMLQRPTPPLDLAAAFRRGANETWANITSVYQLLRGFVQQRVGRKNVGGPILIAQLAYDSASSGLTPFLFFLGILSVNLAVLNFLPIAPLDGGQMLFLVAEKIRGRPLPEAAQAPVMWFGLLLLVSLMALVCFQDISRLIF